MAIKTVTVFCGSRNGNKPEFTSVACQLGEELARNNIALKFGGGRFGIMGALAKSVVENGGAIIPLPTLRSWEIEAMYNDKINRMNDMFDYTDKFTPIFTPNFMERKKLLRSDTDGFCALPGAIGTFDELFEIIVLKKVGEITQPIVLLDVLNYWDSFKKIMNTAIEAGFADESIFDAVTITDKVSEVIPLMCTLSR